MNKNKKTFLLNIILCISIVLFIAFTIIPITKNIKFGLDLQGGFEVLYQVKPITGDLTNDMVTNTYKTIQRRIDVLGVSEPSITVEGSRIRVQLAGVTNPEEARKILGKQANLTFRDTKDTLLMTSDVLKSGGAKVSTDSKGRPAVALSIKDLDTFYKITKQISESEDKTMVIWLDFEEGNTFKNEICGSSGSNCLSAAIVSEAFSSDVIIQGNFTQKEVEELVELINSGSLPTQLEEISSKTVGAEFGENSLHKTLTAGVIGITLIILFMILVYHFSGFIASIGILIYTYITLLLFYLIGGVLTLPGIAALVIGIGMAVDTNVINFARIKDEIKQGSNLKQAFKKGNQNSLITIIDANITTFIVAFILFLFGESSIKGFATMLMLSIFVTMIVMIVITRFLLHLFVKTSYFDKKLNLFLGMKDKKEHKNIQKLDFVKNRKQHFIFVGIIILIGILSISIKGLNLGLDFKGGTSITLKTIQPIQQEKLKEDLKTLNYDLVNIEYLKDSSKEDNTITIKLKNVLKADEVLKAENYFKENYKADTDIGVISNIVKRDLIKNAFKSLLLASIAIIIYVGIRFEWNYAISGILALIHDTFLVIAFFSLFSLEISSIFIAAILSIIGYSINDTIVTFDRIRENLKNIPKEKQTKELLEIVVNDSLRQTVVRSVITTITTLLPILCLILFGSNEIILFNVALLVGFIVGCYSSLYLAGNVWLLLEKRNIGKPNKKKWYEVDEDEPEELSIKGINA